MSNFLETMYECLHVDELYEVLENKEYINELAVKLLYKDTLSESDIHDLDLIIKICNIVYNCTDTDSIVDDGIYDMLIEKYKPYNPNYQVGSDVIKFDPTMVNQGINNDNLAPGIIFYDKDYISKYENALFFSDIMNPYYKIDERDIINQYPNVMYSGETTERRYDTSHVHPELVGTLDKCKFVTCHEADTRGVLNDSNVKILERDFFGDQIAKGIIDPRASYLMTCELKYDGVSVEADCTDIVVSARSRGDTGIGQAVDMTHILYGYRFPHRNPGCEQVGVKFEAIIQKSDLERFNRERGYNYKNGRSAIVGLLGSNDGGLFRDYITLVPLQVEKKVFESDIINSNRVAEIEYLNDNFAKNVCPLRYSAISGTYIELLYQIMIYTEEAEYARSFLPFMYDGVVVNYNDIRLRKVLGRENSVNKWAMAIKFNPMVKQTTFRGYTYTVGQDGSVTPMIHYDPVEFYGTIHPKSSGHSYARFMELGLRIGDIINVEYVNDVMPYVSKADNSYNANNPNPIVPFITHCPICGSPLQISPSGKSVRCVNMNCGGRAVARMVNTFTKLNMADFGEATIIKLGKTHIRDIFNIRFNEGFEFYGFGPGESARLVSEIDKFLSNKIKDYELFGAIGFTNLSRKTWQLIFSTIHYSYINRAHPSHVEHESFMSALRQIKGIGQVALNTIETEYEYYSYDIDYLISIMENNIISTFGTVYNKQIRCTGFRDKELFDHLRSLGYDADDSASVTKNTDILLIPYEGFTSSKTAKISNKCQIITKSDFISNMNKYL